MLERRCKNASAARLHLLSCHFHIPFDSGGTFFNRRGLSDSPGSRDGHRKQWPLQHSLRVAVQSSRFRTVICQTALQQEMFTAVAMCCGKLPPH